MNSASAIGGYFELELPTGKRTFLANAIALNSARNCIEYILAAHEPTKVYIPKYTCDVVLEPFEKKKVPYEFYSLNADLEIAGQPDLKSGELLLYTNYFGIKDSYCRKIAEELGSRLIIDASQALYYSPVGDEHVVYSPRKFLGVPDGGLLLTDKKITEPLETDISYARMSHLLKRLELGPEEGYADFKTNDDSLKMQPVRGMSVLTRRLLETIDYDEVARRRRRNFSHLHDVLGLKNELSISMSECIPMVYPFMSPRAGELREKLIQHRIFVATYWPNVFTWASPDEIEYSLARDILPLPIDQRYDEDDMKKIVEVLS